MKQYLALLAATLALGADGVLAQYRESEPAVLAPPPVPVPAPAPDVGGTFAQIYAAAGSPRIILFWNRILSDRSATTTVARSTIRDTGRSADEASSKSTQGAAGTATLRDAQRSADRTVTLTQGTMSLVDAARTNDLSERENRLIESAFRSTMIRSGVKFVDRALAMRTTAAGKHRSGGDQQLVETDAMVGQADMMMEVVLVPDASAVVGYAFDVQVKDIRRSAHVAATYSQGVPPQQPVAPPTWTTNAEGYVLGPAPTSAPIATSDVGQALARDVMLDLAVVMRRGP